MHITHSRIPRGVEFERSRSNNYSLRGILELLHSCNAELHRAKTHLSGKMCSEFKSDFISINGHNQGHVEGFVNRFKVISTTAGMLNDIGDVSNHCNSLIRDSLWQLKESKEDKYFEAERFIYCRLNDSSRNDLKPTVIMLLVYLKAKKKHQNGIMRKLESILGNIDEREVNGSAAVGKADESLQDALNFPCKGVFLCSIGLLSLFLGLFLSHL